MHGLVGWAICGATVAIGRQLVSMPTTLIAHAIVAPVAFGLLTWNHFRRFRDSSPGKVAVFMVGLVVGLDALLVAPVIERSYDMFRSVLGTWIPFASILAASFLVARWRRRTGSQSEDGESVGGRGVVGGREVSREANEHGRLTRISD
jgi:hypothetical protein